MTKNNQMTIEDLKKKNLIILECISGSKAYGLDTPSSDTDIKGVFLLPKEEFYSLNYIAQINDEKNDVVYYELRRFIELLAKNNPNILELLNTPRESVLYKHEILNKIKPEIFLSKKCKNTFGQFALSQIKKARGLNKKILNPVNKERKTPLDFCYVNYNNASLSINKFLEIKNMKQENCGLINLNHMKNVYGLYYKENANYRGIIQNKDSNSISLTSISKEEKQIAVMYFNNDGYSIYCKEYKEYWKWVSERNEVRYESTLGHGKNYDAKNIMHTFRLLEMAIEIGTESAVNVKRKNREFLLKIKSGEFEYDDLLKMAEERKLKMEQAFENSKLPDSPNLGEINKLLYELRNEFYNLN